MCNQILHNKENNRHICIMIETDILLCKKLGHLCNILSKYLSAIAPDTIVVAVVANES